MLGRKTYTQEEVDHAKAAISAQLAAYKKLARSIDGACADSDAKPALDAFESLFFNTLAVALDRYFVHRIRPVAGKDGNPLNEVELVAESLINNEGALATAKGFKLKPAESVLKIELGEKIMLSASDFDRLSKAFFADLQAKFVA